MSLFIKARINTLSFERCITTHMSNTIRHESNTIRRESNTIRHKSNTIRHESNTIRHKSNTIRHESNTIRHESNTIRHESNTIRHERCNISKKTSIFREKERLLLVDKHNLSVLSNPRVAQINPFNCIFDG